MYACLFVCLYVCLYVSLFVVCLYACLFFVLVVSFLRFWRLVLRSRRLIHLISEDHTHDLGVWFIGSQRLFIYLGVLYIMTLAFYTHNLGVLYI